MLLDPPPPKKNKNNFHVQKGKYLNTIFHAKIWKQSLNSVSMISCLASIRLHQQERASNDNLNIITSCVHTDIRKQVHTTNFNQQGKGPNTLYDGDSIKVQGTKYSMLTRAALINHDLNSQVYDNLCMSQLFCQFIYSITFLKHVYKSMNLLVTSLLLGCVSSKIHERV